MIPEVIEILRWDDFGKRLYLENFKITLQNHNVISQRPSWIKPGDYNTITGKVWNWKLTLIIWKIWLQLSDRSCPITYTSSFSKETLALFAKYDSIKYDSIKCLLYDWRYLELINRLPIEHANSYKEFT